MFWRKLAESVYGAMALALKLGCVGLAALVLPACAARGETRSETGGAAAGAGAASRARLRDRNECRIRAREL